MKSTLHILFAIYNRMALGNANTSGRIINTAYGIRNHIIDGLQTINEFLFTATL